MTQQLTVNTPSLAYPIFIGSKLLDRLDTVLPNLRSKTVIITSRSVADLYLPAVENFLHTQQIPYDSIILPDGEQYKNHDSLNQIYTRLLELHADRNTTLIALGGGVIGDMAGFAAATYQRGIPFIQIPTTLLSQVDSSVGGKTAINHPLGKNMIGAFYQPQAVVIDTDTLKTLPERELAAGMAEVIKYALLGDAAFLDWLEQNIEKFWQFNPDVLTHIIKHCCRMKANIVSRDETEQGIRALLNLGHTFGHAIETEMGYGSWLHGEAVAAGIVLSCRLSEQLGTLHTADTQRVQALLHRAKLPDNPPSFPFERWMAHMSHDKKVQNGILRFITLSRLGQAEIRDIQDLSPIRQTLQPYLPE